MKVGDIVELKDSRCKSKESPIKGTVTGFYSTLDDDRVKVLSNGGHEWILKIRDLKIVKKEKK